MSAFSRALELAAREVAASGHDHVWEHRPNESGNDVTRYQCRICARWGYRKWGTCGRHVPPILAYKPDRKPDPLWSRGAEPETVPFTVPVVLPDRENPAEVTPPTRPWSWD